MNSQSSNQSRVAKRERRIAARLISGPRDAVVVALLLSLVSGLAATAADPRPNIILIFTDDQGYQDLGCFGSPNIKTPVLDQMASEGLRLTSFYAQPVCGVSRAALMTGSYPIRVAEPGNIKRLHTVPHPQEVTMAEVLKSAGYATGLIGKWHLAVDRKDLPSGFGPATMPNAQGFDYFYGTPRFNGFTVNVADTKVRSPIFRNEEIVVKAVENWDNITADYTREAVTFIKQNAINPSSCTWLTTCHTFRWERPRILKEDRRAVSTATPSKKSTGPVARFSKP